jgi:hypothetical protein
VPISNVRIVTKGQSRRTGAYLDGHLINKESKLLSNGSSYAKIVGATSITPTIQSSGVLRRSLGLLIKTRSGGCGVFEPLSTFWTTPRSVL